MVPRHASSDGGFSWKASLVPSLDFYGRRHQPVETLIRLSNGLLLMPTDNASKPSGTAIHLSADNGRSWVDPGGNIAGLHGAVAELKNGSLLAFGRNHDGPCPGQPSKSCMAQSVSHDLGRSFSYSVSPFPGIHAGQRETLLRLAEGPLMMTGYANSNEKPEVYPQLLVKTVTGKLRPVYGLYAAVSYTDGSTWEAHKLISDNSATGHEVESMDGKLFTMNRTHSDPGGYTAAKQGPDGRIHVITSRQHFIFNLAWLLEPSPDLA